MLVISGRATAISVRNSGTLREQKELQMHPTFMHFVRNLPVYALYGMAIWSLPMVLAMQKPPSANPWAFLLPITLALLGVVVQLVTTVVSGEGRGGVSK